MDGMSTNPEILRTKQHFAVLDGMRGIAAITVVAFHFLEMVIPNYSNNIVGHGFLAVDFFFCLSGFVIGYAYDNRISEIGIAEFFKSRLIRLQPLVIFGSILGLLAYFLNPFPHVLDPFTPGKFILIFLCSVFMLPLGTMQSRAYNLFSFNAPAWSLFWEYVANVIYALVLCRLNKRATLIITILSVLPLCYVAWHAGNLMGGWGSPNFWDGSARISFSFMAGLSLYRYNWIIKNNLGFLALAILLLAAFLMPFNIWNWLTEPLVVILYFPFLIALGAGTSLSPKLKNICNFSGKISYPLYMTHYAVIWMWSDYYKFYKPSITSVYLIVSISIILLVGLACLVMTFYDIPVRRYLTNLRGNKIIRNG